MRKIHEEKEGTLLAGDLRGAHVLSIHGTLVGRLKAVALEEGTGRFTGIYVRKGFWGSLYIGKEYIKTIHRRSVQLSVDPYVLYVGRKVISADGKLIGRVSHVLPVRETNTISEVQVRGRLGKRMQFKRSAFKSLGKTLQLKEGAHG